MFLRSTLVKSGDKKIRYWKLVENYHTERGTRQRVVAHLGSLENFSAEDWGKLAERLGEPDMAAALEYRVKNVRRGRPGTRQSPGACPERSRREPEDGEEAVPVYLASISWKNPRGFGDVYVALRFWQRLGLGKLFSELLTGRSAEVNCLVAALMAANRLVAPASEFGMLGWWPRTALPALLGLPVDKVDDNRLYRSLDAILPHKERIEQHLARCGRDLYGREYMALLYDLTSMYFEGSAGCKTGVHWCCGGLGWLSNGIRGIRGQHPGSRDGIGDSGKAQKSFWCGIADGVHGPWDGDRSDALTIAGWVSVDRDREPRECSGICLEVRRGSLAGNTSG